MALFLETVVAASLRASGVFPDCPYRILWQRRYVNNDHSLAAQDALTPPPLR